MTTKNYVAEREKSTQFNWVYTCAQKLMNSQLILPYGTKEKQRVMKKLKTKNRDAWRKRSSHKVHEVSPEESVLRYRTKSQPLTVKASATLATFKCRLKSYLTASVGRSLATSCTFDSWFPRQYVRYDRLWYNTIRKYIFVRPKSWRVACLICCREPKDRKSNENN